MNGRNLSKRHMTLKQQGSILSDADKQLFFSKNKASSIGKSNNNSRERSIAIRRQICGRIPKE